MLAYMTIDLNKYNAANSATGYLYQCRFALYAGLCEIAKNPNLEISIEKLDDVAFESDGDPVKLIQTKHHVSKTGNLTDASIDLWKTLRIWAEQTAQDSQLPFRLSLVLITTGEAPERSAASFLRARDRDEAKAHEILVNVATSSANAANREAYQAFLKLLPEARLSLLRAIKILDGSPNIINVHEEICDELRHAVSRDHLISFVERLEGWWIGAIVRTLMGVGPRALPVSAIENKMDELREGFRRDALPIDYADQTPSDTIVAELDKRPFVHQLRLIEIGSRRVEIAIRDYYRAYEQRSKWAREDLLVDGEVEAYERQLIEAWEPRFEAKREEVEGNSSAEAKVSAGQQIYKWIETEADFPFRTVRQRFLTHGSFHILANQYSIGWHPEYTISRTVDPDKKD